MKTKITFKNFSTTAIIALLLFGFNAKAQTYVYNDGTSSGIFIDGGSEVSNPNSDGVNSSTTCAQSGTGWQKIEFFPTYTPVSGDKIYFSVYNPNNVVSAQIKFDYTSGSTEVWGGNVTYDVGATSGWVEHSLDLTAHVGNEINKIWLYLASGEANSAYVDNVYFYTSSVLTSPAQTYVYNDTISSNIFIDGGSEVSNPNSDGVNSSTTCAQSGTGWQKIEFFPTYTPVSGDKIYFSVYNPNSVISAQIKFDYSSGSTEVWGGNVTYDTGATSGWVEHSLDLTSHVGNEINKIWLYLASGEANSAYVDNIYFGTSSTLSTNSIAQINNRVFISKGGSVHFYKEQKNTFLSIYDITGRLILEEKINGKKGEKVLNHKGIYLLRIKSEYGVSSQKSVYY
ncbi:T9SS type A sorting domain-containing protein [Gaetbulibacter aquiaggeris]|uniref:T9SS type A sorting domain-containing protein n=1 Tax=Gaetbulibacter aquiaggeris TaxID=1735373 RepID=A0ABW7MR18_9FLAO